MKKKYGYIGMAVIVLIFGYFVVTEFVYRAEHNTLLRPDDVSGLKRMPKRNENSSKAKAVGYVVLNGEKKKAPAFEFVDQNGDTISNKDYLGKVYVVEFFYTTCPSICPIMTANLKQVSEAFKGNTDFGIASFSIDPRYDTQEVLKKYAEKYEITNPNWHLMTGKQSDIYDLAQKGFLINVLKEPDEPGGILHDGMFALIDKEGYMRSRKDEFGNPIFYYRGYVKRGKTDEIGQTSQINELIQDIKTLLHEKG